MSLSITNDAGEGECKHGQVMLSLQTGRPSGGGKYSPSSYGMGEGKNSGNTLFQPKPTMPDTRHGKPGYAGSSHGSNSTALGSSSPSYAGLGLFGLTSLQSFATKENTRKKNLIYASFSPEQLLSAVSETKVTTFRFVKKTIEPSAL